jgi:hypothetical protein
MNKKLIMSLILVLIISVSVIVGCSNSKDNTSTEQATVAITVNSETGAIEGDISQELKDELSSATGFFHDYVETSFNVPNLYDQQAMDTLTTYQNEHCSSDLGKYVINYYKTVKDVDKSSIHVSEFSIKSVEKTTDGYAITYFLTLGFNIGNENSIGTKDAPTKALLSLTDGKLTLTKLI